VPSTVALPAGSVIVYTVVSIPRSVSVVRRNELPAAQPALEKIAAGRLVTASAQLLKRGDEETAGWTAWGTNCTFPVSLKPL
jgi:hypothetical protein